MQISKILFIGLMFIQVPLFSMSYLNRNEIDPWKRDKLAIADSIEKSDVDAFYGSFSRVATYWKSAGEIVFLSNPKQVVFMPSRQKIENEIYKFDKKAQEIYNANMSCYLNKTNACPNSPELKKKNDAQTISLAIAVFKKNMEA
ncbi:hypothetical protein HYX58_03205 [Candidatus Dependentiae bacterium]|nr:hypothetical protein [Candidatus Dependentiae bacterium]